MNTDLEEEWFLYYIYRHVATAGMTAGSGLQLLYTYTASTPTLHPQAALLGLGENSPVFYFFVQSVDWLGGGKVCVEFF